MAEPFLAEIRIFGFDFAPDGWAFCDGQILPISQNQSLFALLGTTYGGDGTSSFALPDLRGRTPIHEGDGHPLGQRGGEEVHTLATAEMPEHTHAPQGSSAQVDSNDPDGRLLGVNAGQPYHGFGTATPMAVDMLSLTGGGQPHNTMQPFLALRFAIALQGVFPSQN